MQQQSRRRPAAGERHDRQGPEESVVAAGEIEHQGRTEGQVEPAQRPGADQGRRGREKGSPQGRRHRDARS